MARLLSDAIARHRRPILVVMAVLVAATLLARSLGADPELLAPWLFLTAVTGGLLYALLPLAPSNRKRPDAFDADGRTFRTPPASDVVIAGVTHLSWLGFSVLYGDAWVTAVLLAVLALYPRALRHGVRLTLTPDGLYDEKYAGTVTIPWEAVPTPSSSTTRIRLGIGRPDLVTTTGWTVNRRTLEFGGVGVPFVAAAIEHYRDHPGERVLIGTAEGHGRLKGATTHPSP
ncbi:hypothetical protein [Actinoplanes sp. OR16]|uniref:hypothetical protein n=1 Tax=Actinoplanes sp. OR16 TaxID=946334 RepID=UPI000FDACFCB|nr:hypothetical protein [Actinoplanes sp. OR16]